MRDDARLQSTIELLDEIQCQTLAADRVATQFFRSRRYMGSKDRRAISEMTFDIIRNLAIIDWNVEEPTGRTRVARYLRDFKKMPLKQVITSFTGERHAPNILREHEIAAFKTSTDNAPEWVMLNLPEWLYKQFAEIYGDEVKDLLKFMEQPAPLDMRVNTLKTTVEKAIADLKEHGIEAKPTPLSKVGLRTARGQPLSNTPVFQQGHVDVQDDGSQHVTYLVDAKPKMKVLDFCAGGGGKTLALAATMENSGTLVATDVAERRLKHAKVRLRRAGVTNTECRVLDNKWIKRQAGKFDRVLVDAPCSGTGTWRRNPDLKWRFTDADVLELCAKQHDILKQAATMVKSGGKLVYVTCSLLPQENQQQIEVFLKAHPDFKRAADDVHIVPHKDKSDGFYAGVLEKA